MNLIDVSIVSHGQDDLVKSLLNDLSKNSKLISKVIVTFNKKSDLIINKEYPFELILIYNKVRKGFAENHNHAFSHCDSEYFCVMNPDIKLVHEPFSNLLKCLSEESVGIVAPIVISSEGFLEDSFRKFPTLFDLLKKTFFNSPPKVFEENLIKDCYPDWLAGMFLLVNRKLFEKLKGFDESFYLYYEDVDFSLRSWSIGYKVKLCSSAVIIHDAQRKSHKKLKYFVWHIKSVFKFFIKHFSKYPML